MILYNFLCSNGHVFEAGLVSMHSDNPPCSTCGTRTRRKPPALPLHGRADPGPSQGQRPRSWEQVNHGDRETVHQWQKAIEKREKLEEKYPELAGDYRPVIAHEGIFAGRPLRAGDDLSKSIGDASAAKAPPLGRSE